MRTRRSISIHVRRAYFLTLRLIDQAAAYVERFDEGQQTFGGSRYSALEANQRRKILVELLPWLRGQLGHNRRLIATVEMSDEVLDFVCAENAPRLAELGTSCPDHFLRTKIKPLYVDWNPESEQLETLKSKLDVCLDEYRRDYTAYYEACRRADSPPMRGGEPTVVLIPGLGMIGWGKSKSESRVTAEFYKSAIEVMRGAEAVSTYTALERQEAFDIEYWALEEAKLRRMPAEKELARQIAVVVGAGSGIGREVADRLIRDGAVVAAVDLDRDAARAAADEILTRTGKGIGSAGTGLSGCGDVIGLEADITDRASIKAALEDVILAYGGVDHVIVTAGVYISSDSRGRIPDSSWEDSFRVNVTGSYLLADQAHKIWASQALPGSMVITTSVNAVVAKSGSMSYDASKAAANHLVRELAVKLAPLVRVNGVAPATVVEGSAMFPRDRVIASLAKYGLRHDETEDSETLRQRLADFYAGRTLTKKAITPGDQAEAIFLLVSERLGKTTGQIVNVDGGLPEAFLR
ncbi:MAG: bifunctional rhamnulose-1-phosphate aldolase/short-chain dehydrogenase [Gemmatimonadales bacterium]